MAEYTIETKSRKTKHTFIKDDGCWYRKCSGCGEIKSLDLFRRNRSQPHGRTHLCILCLREYCSKRITDRDREKRREYYRRTYNTKKFAERFKRMENKFPEKFLARRSIQNLVRINKINRLPCVFCGLEKASAHHPDYSKPFQVIWLCCRHHFQVHKKYDPLKVPNKFISDYSLIAEKHWGIKTTPSD